MISTDFGGGIERALGTPDAPIDPKGNLVVPEQAVELPLVGAEDPLLGEEARLAAEAARYAYMARQMGRVVHVVPGEADRLVKDPVDVRPRMVGLLDLFRTTHSQYDPRSGRVVTKSVAKAKPIKPKSSGNNKNTKPGGKKR